MMQNSLERLLTGMAVALRNDVLPAVDDRYARAQTSACVELLGNLATRVDWRTDQLDETVARARVAIDAAIDQSPVLSVLLDSPPAAGDPLTERNHWLAMVSSAIRSCDDEGLDDAAREPLVRFACWHLETELSLLRTATFAN